MVQTLSSIDLPFDQLRTKDLCDLYDERVMKTLQSESAYIKEEVSLCLAPILLRETIIQLEFTAIRVGSFKQSMVHEHDSFLTVRLSHLASLHSMMIPETALPLPPHSPEKGKQNTQQPYP